MKLNQKKLSELFHKSNRLIHFVRERKNYFVRNDEEIEWVKHKALVTVINAMNREKEFESEDHINFYVMQVIDHSFQAYFQFKSALKRQGDERLESELIYNDDDGYNAYTANAITDDGVDIKDDFAYVMSVANDIIDDIGLDIIKLKMQCLNEREIADKLNISQQRVNSKYKSVIKQIKKYVQGDNKKYRPTPSREIMPSVRAEDRAKSEAENKKARDNYIKVLSIISSK